MPEKLLAMLSMKHSGIFLLGMMASRDWILDNSSDLVKIAVVLIGVYVGIQTSLKALTLSTENISNIQQDVVEQQKINIKASNRMLNSISLLEYRLNQVEESVKENAGDIREHYKEDHK